MRETYRICICDCCGRQEKLPEGREIPEDWMGLLISEAKAESNKLVWNTIRYDICSFECGQELVKRKKREEQRIREALMPKLVCFVCGYKIPFDPKVKVKVARCDLCGRENTIPWHLVT